MSRTRHWSREIAGEPALRPPDGETASWGSRTLEKPGSRVAISNALRAGVARTNRRLPGCRAASSKRARLRSPAAPRRGRQRRRAHRTSRSGRRQRRTSSHRMPSDAFSCSATPSRAATQSRSAWPRPAASLATIWRARVDSRSGAASGAYPAVAPSRTSMCNPKRHLRHRYDRSDGCLRRPKVRCAPVAAALSSRCCPRQRRAADRVAFRSTSECLAVMLVPRFAGTLVDADRFYGPPTEPRPSSRRGWTRRPAQSTW